MKKAKKNHDTKAIYAKHQNPEILKYQSSDQEPTIIVASEIDLLKLAAKGVYNVIKI